MAQAVMQLATGRKARKANPGSRQIFRTRSDRPWCPATQPPIQWVPGLSGGKGTGRGADHPPQSSADVRERVKLYIYYPSVPSWQFIG